MLSYRRELDGLRALAVVAVIVYHANLKLFGFQLFQGGFFGVDVFFVLSGYLITGIIRNYMEQGTFSFRDFYWRRAKRIVPALLTMLLVTSGLAYLILLPDDFVIYASSLQSALYFGSNHFFYGEDSYTAAASIYRPLLHTWSLSVEWQFYVVFPFIVWAINRFCPRYMFGILLALALISLQSSSFTVKLNPDLAFYLLPTRAWELILGGLVTFYNRKNTENLVKGSFVSIAYQSLPMIGMFLVVHSMIFIGHEVQHPSFITLLPVLGTCLFIMFSHKGEISNDVMSLKPIVGIGLISYSLYLWHQPIFVFFRLIKHDYFRYEQFLLLVLISGLLSVATYYFIESEFRKNQLKTYKLTLLLLVFAGLVYGSTVVIKADGLPSRYGELSKVLFNIKGQKLIRSDEILDKKIITIGDSHADALSSSLESKFSNYQIVKKLGHGCLSIPYVRRSGNSSLAKACNERVTPEITRLIPTVREQTIVFSARLPWYLSQKMYVNEYGQKEGGGKDGFTPGYYHESTNSLSLEENIIAGLESFARNNTLILVYPVPEIAIHIPNDINNHIGKEMSLLGKISAFEKYEYPKVSLEHYMSRAKDSFSLLDRVEGDNVVRVYPHKSLCDREYCYTEKERLPLYYDDDHLSKYGADLVVREMAKHLP
ncbi:acyltransferase family protein [Vibrio crassostreae]|uniref:acyltransferase family protein n=1 Tax=Vibrio crassostreae TaxID=246167 RepID=UPI00030B801F|nr:acyltransferase family protein [Vibrio crassostreae]OEE94995.1 acyltransferase [Vibrio crassostreae 9ZC77]